MKVKNKINIVALQLICQTLQTALNADNVHINTKTRIIDLLEKIYEDLKK